jgi:hypothetical protein
MSVASGSSCGAYSLKMNSIDFVELLYPIVAALTVVALLNPTTFVEPILTLSLKNDVPALT